MLMASRVAWLPYLPDQQKEYILLCGLSARVLVELRVHRIRDT